MEVNNRILSLFWNSFDFPIRFMFSRIDVINKLLFWKLYSSDFKSLDRAFNKIFFILQKNGISIKDKIILELGPGNSFIIAYNFLMHGAKKVILVDKFPRIFNTKKQKEYFYKELEFIKTKYNSDLFFIKGDSLKSEYLEYVPKTLKEADFKNIDFIYSNSVLEHIKNVENDIVFMSEILNKEGYMYHNIDLRDHYNFNNPFLFYKYENSIWNKYLSKEGVSYTNRLRYDDFMHIFKKYKFETIDLIMEKQEVNQIKISSNFAGKNKEVLGITRFSTLLKKKN